MLPADLPDRIVLISGGSGITPVLSMLRTLCEQRYDGEIVFAHYARTRADWLYRLEVEALAARHRNVRVAYAATREGGTRITPDSLAAHDGATLAVCGPPRLIDAARECWDGELLSETFAPPTLTVAGAAGAPAAGTLRFQRSDLEAPIGRGTLLEQAEAAGLQPEFGCRMGICHTCTCRKSAGAVRNVLTGDVSEEEDEDVQLCISVPAGDVALEL
jgi:ferredoxin-NADP reductase